MLHIVDDEEVVRDSLSWLASSRGIPVRTQFILPVVVSVN